MSFIRQASQRWHEEIPGTRWFKADLHVHTIDDLAGGQVVMPAGFSGDPQDPEVLLSYARLFLRGIIARGVQVVGLTPHASRVGEQPETSAVWKIVGEWNNGTDNGIPFRDKIYAVFPGFEPALKEGREGLHLLFLFDPEVGRERYLRLFDLVMGGVSPWRDKTLQLSNRSADEVFDELRRFRERECPTDDGRPPWGHLLLAPHIGADKGLLGAQRAQVLQLFDHREVAGLELSDAHLPDDALKDRPWLRQGMLDHRQAFFHGSDAYAVKDIGRRHTWLKLASPRIEALRQAFIASDSRMRLGFVRGEDGDLQPISDPPDVMLTERPWLKRVTIRGGASFFGGREGDRPRETCFSLSPDLTCVIGGSMTGKSTFLDGLRVHVAAPLPHDESLRGQVEARGRDLFAAGSPEIEFECPGRDRTAPRHEQWPARFFGQNELESLYREATAIEEILARLAPEETGGIEARRPKMKELDERLGNLAKRLSQLDEQLAEAEQARDRAKAAKDALSVFAEAGVDRLHQAGRDRQVWAGARESADGVHLAVAAASRSAAGFDIPEIEGEVTAALAAAGIDAAELDLPDRWARVRQHLESASGEIAAWSGDSRKIVAALEAHEVRVRTAVERALAARGLDAAKLKEFQELSRQAALVPSYEANLKGTRERFTRDEKEFAELQAQRLALVRAQREAFDRVIAAIDRDFGDRIRAGRVEDGDTSALEDFVHRLAERGITRWWNGLEERERTNPRQLLDYLDGDALGRMGMSEAVQQTFRESMTKAKRRELAALRCPDRYFVGMRLDDGTYRRLDELSGGQRVSVLLSLLLETRDDRPLVIDQPEDQLDNRFLFETVLPALKKLKGRRQVVVATHNANIVVNGDADMVVQLEATAHRGRVGCAGAIEEPALRDAIVRTVDGGAEAFRLRRRKYGF